jgi:predicted aspartyl protease
MRTLRFLVAAVSLAVLCKTQILAETYDATTITAAQILQKAARAEGELAPGAYVRVSTDHYGGVDHTVTVALDGDDWRTTIDGGGFTTMAGSYQGQHWSSDENGVVALNSNFRATSDPNALALKHPEDPKYRVTVLGLTQSEPKDYVIDVNPPDGIDVHLYYNAQTFLLDRRVRFERDRYQHVTEYSDYRNVFGEMEAWRTHSYDGRPQNDDIETIVSFERASTTPDLRIPDSKPLFALDGTAPVVLPAKFTPEGIIIQAKIGDRGYDFFLDSGAAGLFIDPRVTHELGLTPFGRSSETVGGGDVDLGTVRIAQMSIGPLQMHDVAFTTSPFDEQTEGARVVGLIGFDFFASSIIELDFKKQTLTLYPRSLFAATVQAMRAQGARALQLQLDDGIPRVEASVENVPGNFLIDTGAFGMMAYHDYVSKLPTVTTDPEQAEFDTVGGTMRASLLRVTDFKFGGIIFRAADFYEPTTSTFDITDYDGIIGRNALSVYKVTFDYADTLLFLSDNL